MSSSQKNVSINEAEKPVIPKVKKSKNIPEYMRKVFESKCLSSKFGNIPIYQETYFCSSCSETSPICAECFNTCHKSCQKIKTTIAHETYFVCSCGRDMKHCCISKNINQKSEIDQFEKGEDLIIALLKDPKNFSIDNSFTDNFEKIVPKIKMFYTKKKEVFNLKGEHAEYPLYFNHAAQFGFNFNRYGSLENFINFLTYGLSIEKKSPALVTALDYINQVIEGTFFNFYIPTLRPLSADSFASYSLSELLYYKLTLKNQNAFSEEIYEKYIASGDIKNLIKLCSQIFNLIMTTKPNETSYLCYITFIYSSCQYMLFDFESIEIVVNALYEHFNAYELGDHFYLYCDCLLMLGKIYDVLVAERLLEEEDFSHKHIFNNHDIGNKLFIMLTQLLPGEENQRTSEHYLAYYPKMFRNYINMFFFPFCAHKREFNSNFVDDKMELLDIDPNYRTQYQKMIEIAEMLETTRKKCFVTENGVEIAKGLQVFRSVFIEAMRQLKDYLCSRIVFSYDTCYRSYKHYKITKLIRRCFGGMDDGECVRNADDIVEELLYAGIDSILIKCVVQLKTIDTEMFEFVLCVLALFLLTKKGEYYLLQGENLDFLLNLDDTTRENNELMFKFLNLLPKKYIERPIQDTSFYYCEIGSALLNESLNHLNKANTNDTLAKSFYTKVIRECQNYILHFPREKMFDIILNKNKSEYTTEEKIHIKNIFSYFDIIGKYMIHFRRIFVKNDIKGVFDYFDHSDIKKLIKSPNLSQNKKKIIIRAITLFWLGPLYNEDGSLVKPLSNEEYAAYCQMQLMSSKGIHNAKVKTGHLEKNSKEMIEKKIRHLGKVKKLIRIVIHQLKQISNVYQKNTKEYYVNKKLYKTIIRTIAIIIMYIYSFENITNLITFPLCKLIIHFLEKEDILIHCLKINERERDLTLLNTIRQSNFDCLNKEYLLKIMMKEISKFSSLITSKRLYSIFSLYFGNCYIDFFDSNDSNSSPFKFIADLQEKDSELYFLHFPLCEVFHSNPYPYLHWLRKEVKDINSYVYVNVMDTNPKMKTSYFREMFTETFIFDFLGNRYKQNLTVVNVLYKICCYNKDWVIDEFTRNTNHSKEDFFNEIRRALHYFLLANYDISKCYPNMDADAYYGYIAVSLIKLLEMFGEGYNFTFHEYILVKRGVNSPLKFDRTMKELAEESKEEEVTCVDEERTKMRFKKKLKREKRKLKKIIAAQQMTEKDKNDIKKIQSLEEKLKSKKVFKKEPEVEEEIVISPSIPQTEDAVDDDTHSDSISFHSESSVLYNDSNESENEDIPDDKKKNLRDKKELTIFETVVLMLDKAIKEIIRRDKYDFVNPFDNNLLIVISAEIDFLIEFFYTLNKDHEQLIDMSMMWLIKYNLQQSENGLSLFSLLQKDSININKRHLFLKSRLLDLVNSYISSGDKSSLIEYLIKSQTRELSPLSYYQQILLYFDSLMKDLSEYISENKAQGLKKQLKLLEAAQDEESYTKILLNLYIWESEFRESWQLKLIMKYCQFIFLLENKYKMDNIQKFFDEKVKKHSNEEKWTFSEAQTIGVYNFLKQICIPIEMNYMISDKEKEFVLRKEEENEENVEERILERDDTKGIVKIYKKIRTRKTEKEQSIEALIKEKFTQTYFIVPYYSFYLSNQSKVRFEENVDRASKTTKARGLIISIESFLFEMIFNSYIFQRTKFAMAMSKVNYFYFEIINFCFILLHNIILLAHYYKSWTLDQAEYETYEFSNFNDLLDTKNWLLAIIQIVFLLCVIGLWYKHNYIVCYFNNLQTQCDNKTPVLTRIKKYQDTANKLHPDFNKVLDEQFHDIPKSKKYKIAIIDSFLFNPEVCLLNLTLLLLILYLIFQSPFFVILPTLFMAHIFPTLSAVFQGIYSRFGHLSAVYIFTYLVIYIFMWTGFLFFGHLFAFDTINSSNDPVNTEPFCSSSIQCLLFFINYGIRSGGGIGDLLGIPSFKDNYLFFLVIFFYEIAFHLCIVMIFANVFLGLIADAFGELREAAWEKDNDKKNICFICQIDSDTCAVKGIDFEDHCQNKHNIWNYAYFLCYLYMKDENEYNIMEYKIMSSINELNLSWMPIPEGSDED